ncbi:MAG: rhomboid family intramembrane serine protease [Cypionkella sp.]
MTQVLIALNVGMFVYTQLILQGSAQARFIFDWSLIPLRLHYGVGYLTVLSAMFLHGGWLHVGGNMLFLWIFGVNVEARMGKWRYLGFYLTCGIIAALAEYLHDPLARTQVLGASGAIAGVLGAYLRLYPRARIDVFFFFVIFWRTIAIRAWVVLGFWIGFQLYNGLVDPALSDSVAYWEHIGGFAAGFLLSLLVKRSRPAGAAKWSASAIPRIPRRP